LKPNLQNDADFPDGAHGVDKPIMSEAKTVLHRASDLYRVI
jgi:hypothetical protein